MADIFISYSRADREPIRSLAEALQAAGLSVWWDRKIGGGAEFASIIEKELGAAKTVVVAWSAASLGSHWVRDEADYARGENKLLPLSLDGVLPPLGFRQLHALAFRGWDRTANHPAFTALLSSLGHEAPSPARAGSKEEPRWMKPSVAVLPFTNLSTDREIEFLADGLAEDVITSLSINQHISVAARSSSFAYKGQSKDIRDIGKALGARYVIEGSVRKMGNRARVAAQFVGVETGAQIWANKFDHVLDDLYRHPDNAVEQISGSVFAQLITAETDRANNLPDEELGVWEHCQRAAGRIGPVAATIENTSSILQELESAVASAPDYGLAHALLAWCCNDALAHGTYEGNDGGPLLEKAKKHLRIACSRAGDDLYCLTWVGVAETFGGLQGRAVRRLERVLARNPANAVAWFAIAQAYAYLGRHDDASEAIEHAMLIAPEGGMARFHDWYVGFLNHLAGNYEAALPFVKAQTAKSPGHGMSNALAAIDCFILGDVESAKRYVANLKQHSPHLHPRKLFVAFGNQFDKEKSARECAILEELWDS